MKRRLSILVVMLMATTTYAQNSQNYLLGDVNRDGRVTVADAMMVVNIIMKGYTPFSVNPTAVTMFADGTATIDIAGGYNEYEVTSLNTDVVTASLSGSTITLTAVASGETKVTVKDILTMRLLEIPVKVEIPYYLTCPDDHHPHLIDLGLPTGTKWACCNVGADKPEANGEYYAWGETDTKSIYNWNTYIYSDGSNTTCHDLGSDIAGTEHDVVHVKRGGSWVMPSKEQIDELINNCTSTWTIQNGVEGRLFTGTTGGSIFLPAAGTRVNSDLNDAGSVGNYWSSMENPSYAGNAYGLYFHSNSTYCGNDYRSYGHSVRPVVTGTIIPHLKLFDSDLDLVPGMEFVVKIGSGSGHYSVESGDENVATVRIDGNSVIITAIGVGSTTITVTDTKSSETATIEVTVSADQTASLCPDDHHPHLIDLGLPSGTKWACCNVDTDHPENQSPTNYGGYYAWGETETKSVYNEVNYLYATGVDEDGDGWYDDYHSDTNLNGVWQNLGSDIAGTQYDVAHVKWGGSWVMPSYEQQSELQENCTSEWTTVNGVTGRKFTSKKNGGIIFLPAAGRRVVSDLLVGSCGNYWASKQRPSVANQGFEILFFDSDNVYLHCDSRHLGQSVRPVASSSIAANLQLASATLSITEGNVESVEITSGSGSYSVESGDENVATAAIDGNSVIITAIGVGSTIITVNDTDSNETATIEVTVSADQTASLCPDDHHPHLIDLGLPSGTKWACCNVDTDHPENQSPTNYGGYYAWGETETKTRYNGSTYIHCDGTDETCYYLGSDIAGTQYDVAHVKWGGSWGMPSKVQIDELIKKCASEWTTINGVNGRKLTSNINGGTIFLPAAGYCYNRLNEAGSSGYYWSSTQDPSDVPCAYSRSFSSSGFGTWDAGRSLGFSVRPVVSY